MFRELKISASGFTKGPIIAFHISSRRSENRWPADRFIELRRLIVNHFKANILLLWSPGSEKSVYHPGDDEKVEYIKNVMNPKPIAYKTVHLRELVSVLSLSSLVVCCDGGAMHIAAAIGKPILAIWGSTDKRRWMPWKVKNIILQKGVNADEVTVEEALAAFAALWNEYRF